MHAHHRHERLLARKYDPVALMSKNTCMKHAACREVTDTGEESGDKLSSGSMIEHEGCMGIIEVELRGEVTTSYKTIV